MVFFTLLPIKLFYLFIKNNDLVFIYFVIRLTFFLIGFFSLIVFYRIIDQIFSNKILSFVAGFLYIFSPVGFSFFYFIHPETTGSLFLFLGILFFLKFVNNPDNSNNYFTSVVCLVLSSLSKQIFFFISIPVLVLFLHIYCLEKNKKYFEFLFSKEFLNIFLKTSAIAVLLLFIVHPFAIIDFKNFWIYQFQLTGFVNSQYASSFENSFKAWLRVFNSDSLTRFFLLTSLPSLIIAIFKHRKTKNIYYLLFIFNSFTIYIILFLISYLNRLYISSSYTQPIYPLIIMYFIAIINFIWKIQHKWIKYFKYFAQLFLVYFTIFISFSAIIYVISKSIERFQYKDSFIYESYNYVKNNITLSDKVAYDHYVAMPSTLSTVSCHYWNGCGNKKHLENFNPNYVMFYEEFKINGRKHEETKVLESYVKKNNMKLVDKIFDKRSDVVISIYKKNNNKK
jgi:hypothetical protein